MHAGFLPGHLSFNPKFFGFMAASYLCLAALWLALYICHWQRLSILQGFISMVVIVGVVEMFIWCVTLLCPSLVWCLLEHVQQLGHAWPSIACQHVTCLLLKPRPALLKPLLQCTRLAIRTSVVQAIPRHCAWRTTPCRYYAYVQLNAHESQPYIGTGLAAWPNCLRRTLPRLLLLFASMGFCVKLPRHRHSIAIS